MNKLLIVATLVLATTACQPNTRQLEEYEFLLPKALSHCDVHRLHNGRMTVLYVVHCPHATTTTSYDANGKGNYVHTTLVSE